MKRMEGREGEKERDVHHDYAHGKGALCLHAVAADLLVLDNVAALCNVPWRTLVGVLRVDGVGRRLDVDAVGPDDEQGDVE
jgi:hypothetical protein